MLVCIAASAKKPPAFAGFQGKIVSAVNIEGLRSTKPHIVKRELSHNTGDTLKAEKFESDLRNLEKLDIFAEIKPELTIQDDSVAITIRFKEIPPVIVHPTGEYTEENGISLGAGLMATNMWGLNHSAQVSFKTGFESGSVRRVSVEYEVPRLFGSLITLGAWAADEKREDKLNGFIENYRVGRLKLFHTIIRNSHYLLKWRLESTLEGVGADRDSILISDPVCPCGGMDILPGLGATIIYDSRNTGGNPNKGIFAETGAYQYGGPIGGDINYGQWFADIQVHTPVTKRQHLLFSQLLTLQSGVTGRGIPSYRLFWIGGANTVRGYESGARQGKNQWLVNAEYRYLLLEPMLIPLFLFNWYVDMGVQPVAGVDLGTVWDDKLSESKWLEGVYIGLQILVPYIQMGRLEVGFTPAGALDRVGVQFHMSPHTKQEFQRFRRR